MGYLCYVCVTPSVGSADSSPGGDAFGGVVTVGGLLLLGWCVLIRMVHPHRQPFG